MFWIVKRQGALIKLGALLKICLLHGILAYSRLQLHPDIIIAPKLEAPWEISYSGKDLHIFQG